MFTGRKLPLTLAFAVLVALAFGVSCRGFFPKPVLQSITIQPPSPQVAFNQTMNLQAWGVYDTGRSQITSGVAWTSGSPNVLSVDPSSGLAKGLALGSATVTASAQGLSGTASATVYLTNITALAISPTSGSVTHGNGTIADFSALATANNAQINVTSGASWSVSPSATGITASLSTDGTLEEYTADDTVTPGTYTISVTYPGTNIVPTATLTVN